MPWCYATAILKRQYGIGRLEWAKPEHQKGVIAALNRSLKGRLAKAARAGAAYDRFVRLAMRSSNESSMSQRMGTMNSVRNVAVTRPVTKVEAMVPQVTE